MSNEQNINEIDNQFELIEIRNKADIKSETYQRAKDKVRDIQLDTNNKQTASFENFVKEYKNQTDKLNRNILILTIAMVIIGVLGLALQIVSLSLNSHSKVEVIKIDVGR
ncbi:MAG: hypothetical protein A3C58_01060 [Candidatus Staskawiczbacteria bacterium RIFCSPHIGHO2_02_FULL_34_10]|uniref:Uncharacterized protein n=1 Tax=Candidatus Staskawiczbacteria bacterium RIFCSPHIGHO2_02_FULL_34_10 TaxID=1802205 RepID=A0A1G2I0P9_9BACT|nr:MAG: hypothetical protein A3C58_01060 [Candidatus Staskawiczbacteria bacterium RIFCSPHIGHO2_02_FULL_34_10]